jgi:endonuclease/exonuclease/phosphatase family metal-dependent hydrolase
MNKTLAVTLWNVQWASRASKRGPFFMRRLKEAPNDVICITEGHADILPEPGHVITSNRDYGYKLIRGRRKVLLWSRNPWRNVDTFDSSEVPSGRLVTGITDTPCGAVQFVGVCVPWRDAHVRTGRRDRKQWQDHEAYLKHLPSLLTVNRSVPTVLLGDFNQSVPRRRQPERVFTALMHALSPEFQLVTTGPIKNSPNLGVDHLAVSGSLRCIKSECNSSIDAKGSTMSDHFGLRVALR